MTSLSKQTHDSLRKRTTFRAKFQKKWDPLSATGTYISQSRRTSPIHRNIHQPDDSKD